MNAWADFWEAVTAAQLVSWLVGISAVSVLIWKGYPVLKKLIKLIDALLLLPAFMTAQDEFRADIDVKVEAVIADVATIKHELSPNGGDSMADAVHRTEQVAKHTARQVAQLKTKQDRAEKKLDQHIATAAQQVAYLQQNGQLPAVWKDTP